MREVERTARLLVEHVLFERAVVQELHAPLHLQPIRLDPGKLTVELGRLRIELILRVDAEFAMIGMKAEIGEEQHRDHRNDQLAGVAVLVMTGPHEADFAPSCLRPGYRSRCGRRPSMSPESVQRYRDKDMRQAGTYSRSPESLSHATC